VVLDLHPSDWICITACGMEADAINGLMGWNTGLSWRDVEDDDHAKRDRAIERIKDGFASLGSALTDRDDIENESIGVVSAAHLATERPKNLPATSDTKDYMILYSIESA
jgi:hypothetical protein